ncbi:hypothetical protein EDC04DRAFT_2772250 [Pisolithus marmoratus]|nr:hypothetical protein EDC04DRAFT_2772250 [Pisolithus marmoratus]
MRRSINCSEMWQKSFTLSSRILQTLICSLHDALPPSLIRTQVDDAPDHTEFLARFGEGREYEGTIGIYRRCVSAARIGIFDAELINGLPKVAHSGAGYDQVDVHTCKAKGIQVSNTPGAVDDATATMALYLIISCLRHFSLGEHFLAQGTWRTPISSGLTHDLTGRTLGILGLVVCNVRCVLSIHVPLREDTVSLVEEKQIRAMKRGSVIVNTARGKVLDEEAVIRALEDGHLGSVGLDVYPNEPHVNPRLLEFPRNVLLPHMGTGTLDTEKKMEMRALMNLRDSLTAGRGEDLVSELRP